MRTPVLGLSDRRLETAEALQDRRRLIVVTNREPYSLVKAGKSMVYQKTVGGLVSALDLVLRMTRGTWVSWNNSQTSAFSGGGEDMKKPVGKPPYRLVPVNLSDKQVEHYYEGYANSQLWPLFHGFIERCRFNDGDWPYYKMVNQKFAMTTDKLLKPGDPVWVHDYHLCLVPELLRALHPGQKIGFFSHIPFPPPGLFAILPQREEILKGLLGSTLIGFQSSKDVKNFLESVGEFLPSVQMRDNGIFMKDHVCRVMACPIGIDFLFYKSLAEAKSAGQKAEELRKEIGCRWIGLGVDRQDYSKGIRLRLLSLERLLDQHPEYHKQVAFIQIMVPSRTHVAEYQTLKSEIEVEVGRINGRFNEHMWSPILYYYRAFTPNELAAYYRAADFALVTPLKDGMNLVSKEYSACSVKNEGSLILSEFTGAAEQLREAWLVNPYNVQQVTDTLHRVLTLSREEVDSRMSALRYKIHQQDIHWWVKSFLRELLA